MHYKSSKLLPIATTLAIFAGAAAPARAQSADALLDKLVDKGILTVKEAKELREESDKGFTQGYQVKSGMPDWVTSLKLGGDFRGRYDGVYVPSASPGTPVGTIMDDRHRFRYRIRVGTVATLRDNFEIGFRLSSSDPKTVGGPGDPISGNASFQDNGSKKFVFIDQAYAKWTALNTPEWGLVGTIGKMENPFVFSEMIFDADYTPEGAAINLNYNLSEAHSLKLNGGGFMLDELGNNANDPFLAGAQLRWEAAWTPKIATSIGGALLSIVSAKEGLVTGNVPDINFGNSRTGAAGVLDNTFTTFVGDASATYTLESFPFYNAAFPIRVSGEYAENLAATSGKNGYGFGILFGKSGKKGLWDVSYRWKEMHANFWYEELADSDFGGFYQFNTKYNTLTTAPTGSTVVPQPGYGPGVNLRGHVIKLQYSPYDSLTLAGTVYLADVIDKHHPTTGALQTFDSHVTRVQVDAVWKF